MTDNQTALSFPKAEKEASFLFWLPCRKYTFRIPEHPANVFEVLILRLAQAGLVDTVKLAEFTCLDIEFVKLLQQRLAGRGYLSAQGFSLTEKGMGPLESKNDAANGVNRCVLQELVSGSLLPAVFPDMRPGGPPGQPEHAIPFPDPDADIWSRRINISHIRQLQRYLNARGERRWPEFLKCDIGDILLTEQGDKAETVYLQCFLHNDENDSKTVRLSFPVLRNGLVGITQPAVHRRIMAQRGIRDFLSAEIESEPASAPSNDSLKQRWKKIGDYLSQMKGWENVNTPDGRAAYLHAQNRLFENLYNCASMVLYAAALRHHADNACRYLVEMETAEEVCEHLRESAADKYGFDVSGDACGRLFSLPGTMLKCLGPQGMLRECLACLLSYSGNAQLSDALRLLAKSQPDILCQMTVLQEARNAMAHQKLARCALPEAADIMGAIRTAIELFLPGTIPADGAGWEARHGSRQFLYHARAWLHEKFPPREDFPAWDLDVPKKIASAIFQMVSSFIEESEGMAFGITAPLETAMNDVIQAYGLGCDLTEDRERYIVKLCSNAGIPRDKIPGCIAKAKGTHYPKYLAGYTLALFSMATKGELEKLPEGPTRFLNDMATLVEWRGHHESYPHDQLESHAIIVIRSILSLLKAFPLDF